MSSSEDPVFTEEELADTQFETADLMNSGRFIDIVERIRQSQESILNTVKVIKRDVKALSSRVYEFTEKFQQIHPEEDSQVLVGTAELQEVVNTLATSRKEEPFVSIEVDGNVKPLMLERNAKNSLLAASSRREAARIVITTLHDIKDLRKMTRTGAKKRKSNDELSDLSDSDRKGLPLETILFVRKTILKLFPLPELSNPTTSQLNDQDRKFVTDCNTMISSILQYFKENYNEDGQIVHKEGKSRQKCSKTSPIADNVV